MPQLTQNNKENSKLQLNPYQQGVDKALKKAGENQTSEAIQQGVPPEHIIKQAGLQQQDPTQVLTSLVSMMAGQNKPAPSANSNQSIKNNNMNDMIQNEASNIANPQGRTLLGNLLNTLGNFTGINSMNAAVDSVRLSNLGGAQKIINDSSNPEQAIQKLTQLNQMTESVLPGYRFTQTAEGDFVLQPKPAETRGTSAMQNAKDKRTESVINTVYESNNTRQSIDNAMSSVQRLESGLGGKVTYGIIKNLDANNPLLEDWQNLKMALTDAQLMASGPLKGAISDTEQKWLAQAAANDDLISIPRATAVLKKLRRATDVKEKSATESYKRIYKDDPYQWDEVKAVKGGGESGNPAGKGKTITLPSGKTITLGQ